MKKVMLGLVCILAASVLAACASTGNAQSAATPAPAPAAAAVDFSKGAVAIPVKDALPAGTVELLDGFEEGEFWSAVGDSWDQWGAHNLSLISSVTSEKGVTEGANACEWGFDIIKTGGMATFYTDQPAFTDFTGVKYIVIDVLNTVDKDVSIKMAFQTTDGWKWTSSDTVKFGPGQWTLVFNLNSGLTDGNNAALKEIPGIAEMKRLMFNVMESGEKNGSVFVDNIRVIR